MDKNTNSASEQIQKSASFVKAKAAKASDKGKEALSASTKELEKLAADVKKETIKAGDSLDSANKYLKRGFAWADQKMETRTKEAMEKFKELSLKLKKKTV